MKINNRRYTGSKYRLMPWIQEKLSENCRSCKSFIDLFAGTGVVTATLLDTYDSFVINDLLYSNNAIYLAFFGKSPYSQDRLDNIAEIYRGLNSSDLFPNYASDNYGDKYFSLGDAKLIGAIREDIESRKQKKLISEREYWILLASLLYSLDRSANTVGHYEAYIKGKGAPPSSFHFDLIEPFNTLKPISIYREDANSLANHISGDIVFIDPPYNSRQYSRFYHLLETITKWDKPKLSGVAMKPPEENMSDYCRTTAPAAFGELISRLRCKFIAVTYNNTYNSKSNSSQNKITLEQIEGILGRKGKTVIFDHPYHAFNAGKTDLIDHREYLFITRAEA